MGGNKTVKANRQRNRKTKQNSRRKDVKSIDHSEKSVSTFKRPVKFDTFAELVDFAKHCVYAVARLRVDGQSISCTSLGTGFFVGKNRFMTCSHVINNPESNGEKHVDGDMYCLIRRDENGTWHQSPNLLLKNDETLFDYPDSDMAILYIPDSFYSNGNGGYFLHPEHYLPLSKKQVNIGTEVGVLGYPMQQIGFTPDSKLDISGIFIRGDMGIVNTRYYLNGQSEEDKTHFYEFTMAFNPGNSGGPILDIRTGKVVAMVHAYKSIPIQLVIEVRTLYSVGLDVHNYKQYSENHQIVFE
jgi:V8-like Glu-specific endopeptidase